MSNTGITRTSVHPNHALICPESHIPLHFPELPGCECVVLISPEMGAKFSQTLIQVAAGGIARPLRETDETFLLILEGSVTLNFAGEQHQMATDDFCYLPPGPWQVDAAQASQLMTFSKPYIGTDAPAAHFSSLSAVPAEPFLGDPDALLQVLLPDHPSYDWGINLFQFAPGGTLPQVESHFMEHGLYLLEGQGVYRLGDHWYPVEAGDTIWMGPFLPQWYAAIGKTPSRYIYYKEMNRPPIKA